MKKFICKTSYFTVPFLFFYILNVLFYNKDKGDLVNVGYLYTMPSEHKKSKEISKEYTSISEINLNETPSFTIMNIGDSFSLLGNIGYQNFIANETNISVLNIENNPINNPLKVLVKLIDKGFFDKVRVKYVVFESVERYFVKRTQDIAYKDSSSLENYVDKLKSYKLKKVPKEKTFFSKETIKAPLINLNYYTSSNPIGSDTYIVNTNNNFFEKQNKKLLFYKEDISYIKTNNNYENINEANNILNKVQEKLSVKNIELIVLVCPDKFDFYYQFIENKERFEKPLFFERFSQKNRKYHFVNSKGKLLENIDNFKDIYYFSDTHWSPVAAKIVAKEIVKIIDNKKK